MKFKNLNLRAYRHNSLVTLSFDKKDDELRCIISKIKYIDTSHHLIIKIPHGLAENYKAIREIKEEIKQVEHHDDIAKGVALLSQVIEEKIISQEYNHVNKDNFQDWMRIFVYDYLYEVAFNRGIRQERERKKYRNNIGNLTGHDIESLAEQLKLSPVVVDRAVMELVARKGTNDRA